MLKSLAVPLAAALLASAVSGCTFSKVDPNATVTISGTALDATGAPLAGAQVRVFTEADLADLILGGVVALGTLGSICLLPDAPTICHKGHTATTAADGTFSLRIKGSDTQGLIGTEATLDAVIASKNATSSDPSTTLSFTVKKTTVQLPAARLWNAGLKVSQSKDHIQLRWNALPSSYGSKAAFSANVYIPNQQAALWIQSAKGTAADIDPRVIEDINGTAAAGARTSLDGTGTGTVHANYLSGRLPVRATAGAPPSRHRACDAVMGIANFTTATQASCGATDGNLVSPARLTGTKAAVVTGAVIDMGRPVHISLVDAHGIAGLTDVELSNDGKSYHQVGILADSLSSFSPPGDPVARYVRVRAPSGLDESLLYEISVWSS